MVCGDISWGNYDNYDYCKTISKDELFVKPIDLIKLFTLFYYQIASPPP